MQTETTPAGARTAAAAKSVGRQMLNKVPEITIFFWVIKILATTVGETAADFLNETMHLGFTTTSVLMTGLLVITLVFQFRARKYVPAIYWLAVALISIVGTLVSDFLVDGLNVPLHTTTLIFGVLLVIAFGIWYAQERTLSIHTINTRKREAFYWMAILFTFALGTSAGDWIAEGLNLGYWKSAVMFLVAIAVIALAHFRFKLSEGLAFWGAYILTRPLGASLGDLMSQPRADGGFGLGTTGTSAIFLGLILVAVVYLTITKRDQRPAGEAAAIEAAALPEGADA